MVVVVVGLNGCRGNELVTGCGVYFRTFSNMFVKVWSAFQNTPDIKH